LVLNLLAKDGDLSGPVRGIEVGDRILSILIVRRNIPSVELGVVEQMNLAITYLPVNPEFDVRFCHGIAP
jgi:hypothetical protein